MANEGKIIGIDLGTTFSLAASARIALPSSALVPSSRTTMGHGRSRLPSASTIPRATRSQPAPFMAESISSVRLPTFVRAIHLIRVPFFLRSSHRASTRSFWIVITSS